LYNIPDSQLRRLQLIQNSLARAVFKAPKFSDVSPFLRSLHWLKIKERIEYKPLSLTYKVLTTSQPSYLSDLCLTHSIHSFWICGHSCSPTGHLLSQDHKPLFSPCIEWFTERFTCSLTIAHPSEPKRARHGATTVKLIETNALTATGTPNRHVGLYVVYVRQVTLNTEVLKKTKTLRNEPSLSTVMEVLQMTH